MPLAEGSKLGPYEIISLTGSGGMGEVYKAKDTRLDRIVAIKVLPPELTSNPDIKLRFEREAKSISSLNHPNICILFDIGNQDGVEYLVMEFLEGKTLFERLQEGPLTNDELIKYSLQIVDALDKAHKQGLIHRDLKPSNVMLTKEGAKLLDFGLAKLQAPVTGLGGNSDVTRTTTPLTEKGSIIGTLQYMSPEQLEGEEADSRSDIFSFGAMLYEMVTGKRAFTGGSKASLIASVLKEQPKAVSEIQPLAPPMFERIIKQCLAKDKDDRWQTAGDLKHAIEWIAEGGSQVGIPRTVSRKRKLRERVGISLTFVLLLSTLYLGYEYAMNAMQPQEVVKSYINPQEGFRYANYVGGQFALSPDGTKLAYAAVDTTAGSKRQLWIQSLNSLSAISLPGTENARFPFWSPDSRYVAFFDDNNLKKILATGGPALTLCKADQGRGGSWNKEGLILFSPEQDEVIHKVASAGGESVPITVKDTIFDDYTHRWVQFMPDGDHFIFHARTGSPGGSDKDATCLSSLSEGKVTRLFKARSNAVYANGHILYNNENILMSIGFDENSFELIGEAVPLAEKVSYIKRWSKGIFTTSNNGKLIYRSGEVASGSQLYIQNRQGDILDSVGSKETQYVPALSPDEKFVASEITDEGSSKVDIWIYNLQRGIKTRFTFDSTDQSASVWSPDGSQIAFAHEKENGGIDIVVKNSNGTGKEKILYESEYESFPFSWSSDGRFIAFMIDEPNYGNDIWILPLDTTKEAYPFLNTPFQELLPMFSPDGRWLAYFANESGKMEVYVTAFPQAGSKWQVSINTGVAPRWSADGKELFFVNDINNMLSVAEVDGTGSSFEVGKVTELFKLNTTQGTGFDVFKDGQRFLTNQLGETKNESPVILVQNWPAELEE